MYHDTFNADFYITAATVIPLLYLALTLQGQTYERIISRSVAEFVKGREYQVQKNLNQMLHQMQDWLSELMLVDDEWTSDHHLRRMEDEIEESLPPGMTLPVPLKHMLEKARQGERLTPDMFDEGVPSGVLRRFRRGPIASPNWQLFWVLNVIGGIIVFAGAVGEGLTIWALYDKPSSEVIALAVLFLVFVLLVAVVAVPVFRVRTLYRRLVSYDISKAENGENEAASARTSENPSD